MENKTVWQIADEIEKRFVSSIESYLLTKGESKTMFGHISITYSTILQEIFGYDKQKISDIVKSTQKDISDNYPEMLKK